MQPAAPVLDPASAPVTALAIVNARVWTGDRRRPWADAVLVRGERIEAVGSSAEIKKRAGAGVRVIDAKGMTLASVLLDARVDFLGGGSLQGKEVGVLVPGMLADLLLLEGDITRVVPETIRNAQVMLRMVGGRVVYDRTGLAQ
jgi:predicted amidohydrolase YtcJ